MTDKGAKAIAEAIVIAGFLIFCGLNCLSIGS